MKKRFFPYLLIGLSALLVFIGFVPTILSTKMAKDQMLKEINNRIPGRLAIDQWSFGWLDGIQCEKVAYKNNGANISIRIDRIAVPKGLLALAFNYQAPGLIEIIRPQGIIALPGKVLPPGEPGENESPSSSESEVSIFGNTPSNDSENRSGEKARRFVLPPIAAEIKISGGSMKIIYPNKKEEVIAKGLMLNFN